MWYMSEYGNYLDHLEHKAHKYVSRKWANGRWNYFYDHVITGKAYKKEAADQQKKVDRINYSLNSHVYKDAKRYNSGEIFDKDKPGNVAAQKNQLNQQVARLEADRKRARDKAEKAKNDYSTKSIAGISSKIIDKGKRKLTELINSKKDQPISNAKKPSETKPAATSSNTHSESTASGNGKAKRPISHPKNVTGKATVHRRKDSNPLWTEKGGQGLQSQTYLPYQNQRYWESQNRKEAAAQKIKKRVKKN